MSFASRLKNLRERAGLSQEALARKADISSAGLRHIEQGVSDDPKWSTVVALADALGVPTDAFRDVDEGPAAEQPEAPAPEPKKPDRRRKPKE